MEKFLQEVDKAIASFEEARRKQEEKVEELKKLLKALAERANSSKVAIRVVTEEEGGKDAFRVLPMGEIQLLSLGSLQEEGEWEWVPFPRVDEIQVSHLREGSRLASMLRLALVGKAKIEVENY